MTSLRGRAVEYATGVTADALPALQAHLDARLAPFIARADASPFAHWVAHGVFEMSFGQRVAMRLMRLNDIKLMAKFTRTDLI